jgi:hypothetical protein
MSIKTKIAKLEEKARSEGKYAVAATASDLLNNLGSIDCQINLVGAMHEVGYLQNSLAPYWKEFRADKSAWVIRCLSRLLSSDSDYWAVASLLGCRNVEVIARAKVLGFTSVALSRYSRFDKPDVRVNTLFKDRAGSVLYPLIEVGSDSDSGVVVDFVRARALALDKERWQIGKPIGNGSLSYFMRAVLPHGAWRMQSSEYEMK